MKKLTFKATCENIPLAIRFVNEYLFENNIVFVDKFDIVIDEIFSNISKYAYKTSNKNITIICNYNKVRNQILITFKDSGFAYNPLDAVEPDITIPVEERPNGGLGLFIVKNIIDEMKYIRKNKKNILTLKKTLDKN